ncbi:MAG: hypothetical protein LBU12_07790 [Deltaproteobacteria bacterium]|jgi:nucleoside phosphorylase|nr:hypothetical protein [Deltaproteobacteria bacterium]
MKPVKEILILTPTPNEHRSVKAHVGRAGFDKIKCTVVECGPGKINAAFKAAEELSTRRDEDVVLIGAGTAGSLTKELRAGQVIASRAALISDWRMEDGDEVKVSPYGWFDYREPAPEQVAKMTLECRDPLMAAFFDRLPSAQWRLGRLLTSDAFVAGQKRKLELGRIFGCLACDMESGAFGYVAEKLSPRPWANFRVVADTLDDALDDYFAMERDMTEILGRQLVEALNILDRLL